MTPTNDINTGATRVEEASSSGVRTTTWQDAAERLDKVLPALGLARSRTQAAELISAGGVTVNGAVVQKTGFKVQPEAIITVVEPDRYVSRAAHKLIAGLDAFGVDPRGRLALDLGASTGGFTQVLLERGARAVQAIDVGHGQLVDELRGDARVHLVEGCNARDLDAASLAELTGVEEAPDLVVADLSFISLTLILPAIARSTAREAELILLIKPQFEVGRVRDGIVTDPNLRADAIRTVLRSAATHGFAAHGLEISPIAGGHGNREFLVKLQRAENPDPAEWEERIVALGADAPSRDLVTPSPHTMQTDGAA